MAQCQRENRTRAPLSDGPNFTSRDDVRQAKLAVRPSIFPQLRRDQAPKTTVIDTAAIKAPPGKGCPRCGGVVFAAELVLAKSREWHRKCFKCRDCTKTLDSIIACDGPDGDVYCKLTRQKWACGGWIRFAASGFCRPTV
ncbi:Muscle LIM protein Mlp84B [Eumeta japonica]|uniref:Muscle LIM protein Mlp84B n=1 Tax=Eumeta variegata TaxID=151549 RepID=A0A4C1SCN3_EUMVA|nr:Muscle LIM protein Mlp84B [Eumeta japonica]